MHRLLEIVFFSTLVSIVYCQFNLNQWPDRGGIVHLFEWKWKDVALECERFLSVSKFGGVLVSPPNENLIMKGRPWYERYQPISYKLISRSGNEAEFLDMTFRCNRVGVRVYADAVINHMSAPYDQAEIGTGGSTANASAKSYPAVPYSAADFHSNCDISNYDDANEVRNCRLNFLNDLDHSKENVRERIVDYMNKLVDLGVAGFRIDAAKHMEPKDLEAILSRLRFLNIFHGFLPFTRPFIYLEVIGGSDAIKPTEYTSLGIVTEFKYSMEIGKAFRGDNQLKWLKNFGSEWNFLPSHLALTFVDNHDTQRSSDFGSLTYKDSRRYKMANAFQLAWPYGTPQLMSSFEFTSFEQGPPMDRHESIISPTIQGDSSCGAGMICEHRWRQIANMNLFKVAAQDTEVENWWDNGNNQIAFSRGKIGFVAFNGEAGAMNVTLQTGLPAGTYCDIISGKLCGLFCTAGFATVGSDGMANIMISSEAYDGVFAIYRDSKVPNM